MKKLHYKITASLFFISCLSLGINNMVSFSETKATTEAETKANEEEEDADSDGEDIEYSHEMEDGYSSLSKISKDPLKDIGKSDVDNSQIKKLGGDVISVFRTFAVFGAAMSIVLGAITLMTSGYKSKNKVATDVMTKLIVLAVFAGLSFFVSIILTLVKAL